MYRCHGFKGKQRWKYVYSVKGNWHEKCENERQSISLAWQLTLKHHTYLLSVSALHFGDSNSKDLVNFTTWKIKEEEIAKAVMDTVLFTEEKILYLGETKSKPRVNPEMSFICWQVPSKNKRLQGRPQSELLAVGQISNISWLFLCYVVCAVTLAWCLATLARLLTHLFLIMSRVLASKCFSQVLAGDVLINISCTFL